MQTMKAFVKAIGSYIYDVFFYFFNVLKYWKNTIRHRFRNIKSFGFFKTLLSPITCIPEVIVLVNHYFRKIRRPEQDAFYREQRQMSASAGSALVSTRRYGI